MQFQLQQFKIKGLHNSYDYEINIRDNRIVMVGQNGLGKTTIVSILYLVLSRQWDQLSSFEFQSVQITVNGKRFEFQRNASGWERDQQPFAFDVFRSFLNKRTPSGYFEDADYLRLSKALIDNGVNGCLDEMVRTTALPTQLCRQIVYELEAQMGSRFPASQRLEFEEFFQSSASGCQVLYLPTFRRIEKELALIIPEFEEQQRLTMRRKASMRREANKGFIELVEFGMEDVEATFKRVRTELSESARNELNSLAAGQLRDVIRGQGESYEPRTFQDLSDSKISRVLNRVDDKTLSEDDKRRLRQVIGKLTSPGQAQMSTVDNYIVHFFAKLFEVDRVQSQREQLIVSFADVCNNYLVGKKMFYDDKNSSIELRLTKNGKPLALKSLSSGEKQIVSLFSHLYLGGNEQFFVIIDEPELSLSVLWQQRLLPDIIDTKKCHFLAAVTHSPFIFENSLDPYAIDLSECVTEDKGCR